MVYKLDRIDKFHVITDQGYPGTDAFFKYTKNNFLNLIDGIIGSPKVEFTIIQDINNAYKYLLFRDRKDVGKWYKSDTYTLVTPNVKGKSKQLIFVVNNVNGFVDDIIYKCQFYEINDRIKHNNRVYVVSSHSINRAMGRMEEMIDLNRFEVYNRLIKKVNIRAQPCHIEKKYEAFALLEHNFQKADYYIDDNGYVYVVHDHTLLTVHGNESERWKRN